MPHALKSARRLLAAALAAAGRGVALFICLAAFAAQAAVPLLDTYYSPKNKERPVRSSTRFIILHTTEGSSRGSGAKLQKNGEAHYMVDEAGRIYRIIDRKRVAYHCGRSMWNGLSSLDNYSVGIEVVGYHNKNLTQAQYKALKDLLAELKSAYKIPDDKVLTHSMVAYGAPNQWHKRSHRGRKRCGMRMALPSVRRQLGLNSKPAYDPDVKARRLVVADKELFQLLYSVEKGSGASSRRTPVKPAQSKPAPVSDKGASAKPGGKPAAGTSGVRPASARSSSPPALTPVARSSGAASTADDLHAPVDEEEAAARYAAREAASGGNVIGPRRSAWDIARDAYNSASTLYEFPDGTRKTGAEIKNWKAMPAGTRVTLAEGDVNEPEKIDSVASAGLSQAVIAGTTDAALDAILGDEWNSERTVYVSPDGKYVKGSELNAEKLAALSPDTKVFNGYKVGGPVTARNPAFNICGPSWRDEGTHFLFPNGTIVTGDKVDPGKIPAKTMILYKD